MQALDLRLFLEAQKGVQLALASEDPAIDSGLSTQSPSANDIASSLATPLQQPAFGDQFSCTTIIGTH